jgi:hypothetical protein
MRKSVFLVITLFILLFGCGEANPIAVEIKEVCSQPMGTNVTIQGYLSLPQMLEVTKYTRKGQSVSMSYKLFLMTQPDASSDAVPVILSVTGISEPNKIKTLPDKYTWNDLIAYTDDGKTSVAGNLIKLTGKVNPNDKNICQVNVLKIENP